MKKICDAIHPIASDIRNRNEYSRERRLLGQSGASDVWLIDRGNVKRWRVRLTPATFIQQGWPPQQVMVIQPLDGGDHWHADFLQITAHGIQIHGTVVPACGAKSRYRMTSSELKTCLKQLNWTQEKLANAFHVSRSTVKKWAQGRAKVPGPAIVLIKLMIENAAYLHRHRIESLSDSPAAASPPSPSSE